MGFTRLPNRAFKFSFQDSGFGVLAHSSTLLQRKFGSTATTVPKNHGLGVCYLGTKELQIRVEVLEDTFLRKGELFHLKVLHSAYCICPKAYNINRAFRRQGKAVEKPWTFFTIRFGVSWVPHKSLPSLLYGNREQSFCTPKSQVAQSKTPHFWEHPA